MGFVGLACCVALAAVLAASGVAKLLDRGGTREAVIGFGVPTGLAPWVAGGLAPAELVTALLLVVPGTRAAGLVLATLLLLAFTAAVVRALGAGRRPECHCFGRIGGADVSRRTVARNLTLLAVAAAGLVGAATGDLPDGAGAVGAVVVGLTLAAMMLTAEGVAGAQARARRAVEDEAAYQIVGSQSIPPFTAETLTGRISRDELLATGLPALLITLSPGCGPCMKLRPEVARWSELLREGLTVAVLATGTADSNRAAYADNPDLTVMIGATEVQEALGIAGAPSAVLVGADGRVTSGVASGEKLVRRLLVTAVTGVDAAELDSTGRPGNDDSEDIMDADDLDLSSVVASRPGVIQQLLGESTVVLDPMSGATVALDQTGAMVWSVLDGRGRLDEIVTDLADIYGVPAEVIGPDVLGLVQSLGRAGLLRGIAAVHQSDSAAVVGAPADQAGHDHAGHDHAGHDHAGHDHAGHGDDVEAARPV